VIVCRIRARDHDLAAVGKRDIDRPTPRRVGRFDGLGHVVGLVAAMLAGPKCPIPAVPAWILRPHLRRQLVERLGTECGVPFQVDRVDAVSRIHQGGDDASG